jgi:lipopolysaccharide exporter
MSMSEVSPPDSPERQMVRGSIWAITARWVMRGTGLVSIIILARLLTPSDYGVVAIAMLIVTMVEVLNQTGQYAAIIRHPNPTREHYDSAWTVSLLLGFLLALLIWALIPFATTYFREPRAAAVLEVLALRTVFYGAQNVGIVNFRRNLQFDKQAWFTIGPALAAVVLTIGSAITLRNYWALVIGAVGRHAFAVLLSYTMEPYRPRISFSKVGEIWSFSVWTLLKSIGIFVNNQMDKIAIGGFAGAAGMGRYEVARDIAIGPGQELIDPMVGVLFPVMAKVQYDKEKRRRLYLSVLYWSAIVCASTCVGIALVAEDITDVLLGPQWHDVDVLIPWFALAWGLLAISGSVYSAFDTLGRPVVSARLQWARVVVLAAVIFPVAYVWEDLQLVVIAQFAVTLVVTPGLFYALSKALDVPMYQFAVVIWRPVVASVVMTGAVLLVNYLISFTGIARLLADVAVGSATFAGSLMVLWFVVGRPEGPEQIVWMHLRHRLNHDAPEVVRGR